MRVDGGQQTQRHFGEYGVADETIRAGSASLYICFFNPTMNSTEGDHPAQASRASFSPSVSRPSYHPGLLAALS
jgi:hypothetical protein